MSHKSTLFYHFQDVPPDLWRWPNFSPDEPNLACPHCGEFWLDPHSMDLLQSARTALGKPMRINSGHRCRIHNARVGGAPLSEHKKIAFDILLAGRDPRDVLEACQQAGFTTFGFYGTFLHTDRRSGRRWLSKSGKKTMDVLTSLIGGIAGEAVTAVTGGGVFGLIGSLVGHWQKGRQEAA